MGAPLMNLLPAPAEIQIIELHNATIDNLLKPKHISIDLVRIDDNRKSNGNYEGICW